MVSGVALPNEAGVAATIIEDEGTTAVIRVEHAERQGIVTAFLMAWLTLGVLSSLDAVGLTAAVATALADEGIACNVLTGSHHDHLLVAVERAERAIEVLCALGEPTPSP
jgi:hypothetical protein